MATANAAVATAQTPDAAPPPAPPVEIEPRDVQINTEGFAWRTWLVRLPKGIVAGDLGATDLFKKVQSNPATAMRKYDEVRLIANDESWLADATVSHADNTTVVLAKPKITQLPERTKPFLSDGTYSVAWVGNGYAVKRLSDGQQMSQPTSNEAQAERDLSALYGRRV